MARKIIIGLLVVLVVIQLIRPGRNDSGDFSKDITTAYTVPDDVQAILKKSCYDCHSNYTTYPWYDRVQPVAWWLEHHINEGKAELNFSEFAGYSIKKQAHKLEEVAELVEKGAMPLKSYLLLHGDAKLTDAQRTTLVNWAKLLQQRISDNNSLSLNQ